MTPQEQPDIETLTTEIAAGLRSWNQKRHEEAERTLKSLGPQGVEVLLHILQEEKFKLKKRVRVHWWVIGTYFLLIVLFSVRPSHWFSGSILFFTLLNFVLSIGMAQLLIPSGCYFKARRLMAEYDDIRAIPSLLETLPANEDARTALTLLLPRLRASDAPLLSPLHRKKLYQELSPNRRTFSPSSLPNYTLAILQALEQIGDKDAIPAVTTLFEETGNARLMDAAKRCLEYLYAHAEGRTEAQSLLRPSSANGETEDTLLRPVQTAPDTTPIEQLLRPRE